MGKKKDIDVFDIRTLSFYQQEGGVYNELITILTKLRSNSNVRLSMPPAKVLNEACRICDKFNKSSKKNYIKDLDYWWETLGREGNIERLVIFSTMYILSTGLPNLDPSLTVELKRRLGNDKTIFPFFNAIPHDHSNTLSTPLPSEVEKQLNDLRKRIEEKNNEIRQLKEARSEDAAIYFKVENNALKEKYEILALESLQKEIDYKAQIADLEQQHMNMKFELAKLKETHIYRPPTEADKVLNLNNIMAYIESRGKYENCTQLFTMLDKLVRRIVTDEQLSQIDALEEKMIAMSKGECVTINNDIHGNKGAIMPGTVNMNK